MAEMGEFRGRLGGGSGDFVNLSTDLTIGNLPISGVFSALLDEMVEGLYFANIERTILLWNKAAESISGYSADEVLGKSCAQNILVHTNSAGQNLCEMMCPLRCAAEQGTRNVAEIFLRHKDGHRVPVRVSVFPAYDVDGSLVGSFELFSENSSVAETRRRMLMLEEMAYADSLTKLANRRYLDAKLETFLEEYRRHSWTFGFLMFDLDRFKRINDLWGHAGGDSVLKSVGNTLLHASRTIDVIGRWGGEEFAGLFRGIDSQRLEVLANRFRGLVSSLSVRWDDGYIQPTVSVGGTIARPGDTAASIMERADQALYEAKSAGRNCVRMMD